MIFVDSNIPMYLVGGAHPNRDLARQAVELAIARREPLVTDAEAFQEILHRYVAIDRRDAIDAAWRTLRALVDDVAAIELGDVEAARALVVTTKLTARDALHVAVMRRLAVEEILTFDRDFDLVPGIRRLPA
ncbi:MAG TPA: type II toxin-antitoxin system VapC family toxin [Candidatus Limnocylindrales bacterium]|nr:type II toxin-antitoxin system VapC family toxin [Candidatus Limnocylindrales bacterium]